jgi:electron transport complex protein RnfD
MEKLIVSTSPHIHSSLTTQRIMLDVLIALSPAVIASLVLYDLRALLLLVVTVASAVGSEFLFNLCAKKEQTVTDLSAVVTGVLLALSLPASTTVWQCIVGGAFAIVIVKCFFGGLGNNFANPAVTARVFVLLAFAEVGASVAPNFAELESGATPLVTLAKGGTLPEIWEMLLGLRGGAIGEGCAVALLLGFAYLVYRRVIHWEVPTVFVVTLFVLSWILSGDITLAFYYVLSGGALFAAIFMITDYVSTPITFGGKLVFAFGAALITVLIRFYGSYPEGVSFAILLMNILSPYIEKWTTKKPFGGAGK